MHKQTSKSLPFKQGRKQSQFKPFEKEFHEPIVSNFSSTTQVAAYVPKGNIKYRTIFQRYGEFQEIPIRGTMPKIFQPNLMRCLKF